MLFNQASNISILTFLLLYSLTQFVVIKSIYNLKSAKKWILLYLALTIIVSTLAQLGITASNIIPIAPLLFGINILFAVLLVNSNFGKEVVKNITYKQLLGLQVFRVPLEIILYLWSTSKTVPDTLTWSGQNYDIISGLICFSFIPLYNKNKASIWFANIISSLLLINVIRVVILSSPFPISWDLKIPLQLIMHFPYALIVPGFVVVAISSHLLVFRKLLNEN